MGLEDGWPLAGATTADTRWQPHIPLLCLPVCVCVHNGVPRTPLPAHDCPLMPHSHSSSNAYATQPRPAQCDTTTTAGLARRQRNAKKITYKH